MDFKVNLSRPDVGQAEIDAVSEVLRGPNLSLGPKLGEFEGAFADYIGRKRAVAVNSGTSGLFLCAKALDIGEGDEVITTPFTFIASATSMMMAGAKPVFVDIDPESLNIDTSRIEEKITDKTRAILPVEIFGSPVGIEEVCEIAARHKLAVIEDSCEALGSQLNGKKTGSFGTMSLFAFYPNKQMTTGEGGIILTDNDELADTCESLRNQGRGKDGGWLGHEQLGYNYRLSDINCAMGIVQLSRIEEFVAKRRKVAEMYQDILGEENRLTVPAEPAGARMSWFVFVVRLNKEYKLDQRNAILKKMLEKGVQVSNYFPPLHLQPFMVKEYGFKKGDFPITESVSERTIALPFHNNLSRQEIEIVCAALKDSLDETTTS